MVSDLQSDTYAGRLAELGLDSLQERRHVSDMVLMNKIAQDFNALEFIDLVQNFHATRAIADPLNI
jgi:hypothetical protein